MKQLMRMLMMFGPMIYRQYQKYQQNKATKQSTQGIDNPLNKGKYI